MPSPESCFVRRLLGQGSELRGIHGTEKEARDNLWHANSVNRVYLYEVV